MFTDEHHPTGDTLRDLDAQPIRRAFDRWRQELLDQRVPVSESTAGYWEGQLSPSALSTATAVSALSTVLIEQPQQTEYEQERLYELIRGGIGYLRQSQNADGGFGDTDRSRSNIATTYLALAAQRLARRVAKSNGDSAADAGLTDAQTRHAEAYIEQAGGWDGLRRRYGKDKTFVVPILTNCAIAGMVDWKQVSPLPFEAAVFPQSMYRFLRMPVVSYAIPALVAIGQARFFLGPKPLPPVGWVRAAAVGRTMQVLRQMQPESGGYLEATPLTSFVLMSLAATGRGGCEVAQACVRFLIDSVLEEGSWPIDTNLATFVTSLAVHALHMDPTDDKSWISDRLIDWHLNCQHTERHPFTGADPGGWGWTDLSGAVPDGDDTPGAILALHAYRESRSDSSQPLTDELAGRITRSITAGCEWLLRLQNRDGGWPTFCRGWGKLPFDRSSVDLTAHALRALNRSRDDLRAGDGHEPGTAESSAALERAMNRGWRYLEKSQRSDGSWLPLWFGNQDLEDDENPFYGTGRVLLAIAEAGDPRSSMAQRACSYLLDRQNADGGWGGGPTLTDWLKRQRLESRDRETGANISSSVEESAVVLEGLAALYELQRHKSAGPRFDGLAGVGEAADSARDSQNRGPVGGETGLQAAILSAGRFLDQAIQHDRHRTPWPIGFYFAKLWYHERLYPAVFATAALARVLNSLWSHDTEEVFRDSVLKNDTTSDY